MKIKVRSVKHFKLVKTPIVGKVRKEFKEHGFIVLEFPLLESAQADTVALEITHAINLVSKIPAQCTMGAQEYTIKRVIIEPEEETK